MPFSRPVISRFAGGALFGLYMAFLLYFLNPQIESTVVKLTVAVVTYALICGLVFGTILLVIHRLRVKFGPGEAGPPEQSVTGFSVVATFAAGLVYWWHLALLRIYLPAGAVRILSKATLLLAAAALLLFAFWLLERSSESERIRRWSRIGAVMVVLICAALLFVRRDRYRPAVGTSLGALPVRSAATTAQTVVAVRSLSYDWIMQLRTEGVIPQIGQFITESFVARVEPFRSTSPKAVLASLATGKLPYRHGVTGRFSYRTLLNRRDKPYLLLPSGVGFRGWGLLPPVERISAQLPSGEAKPFWKILTSQGQRASVVGWPGVQTRHERNEQAITFSEKSPRLEFHRLRWLRKLSVDPSLARRDVPAIIRQQAIDSLARDLAAISLLEEIGSNVGTRVVMLQGFDRFLQRLQPGVRLPSESTPRGALIRAYLRAIDREFGSLREGPGSNLVLISPSSHLPPQLPVTPYGVGISPFDDQVGEGDGILAIHGKSVRAHTLTTPVAVVDFIPTLLFSLELPAARDMDGRVLTEAFDEKVLRDRGVVMVQSFE